MSAHGKENILKSIILQQKNSPALVKGKLWKNCPLTIVLFREQKLKVTGRDTVCVCVHMHTHAGVCAFTGSDENDLIRHRKKEGLKNCLVIKEQLSEKNCSWPSGNIFRIILCHRKRLN